MENTKEVNPWVVDKLARMSPEWLENNREKLLARHDVTDIHFAVWLEMFDIIVRNRTYMSYRDLEDWDYWSNYDAGSTPRDAVDDMFEDMEMDWVGPR